jgi:hypothetical protein
VIYEKEMPIILPTDVADEIILKQLYVKSDVWEYEDEYRVTKVHGADTIVEFKPSDVAEIIIGASMKESNIKSILNICKCNFPSIPVFQAYVISNTFAIGFDKIN